MRRKTTSEFIKDSKKIHGDKYDYSLVEYIGARTKVKIICPQHGEFEQRPGAHFNGGRGCKQCGFNIRQRLTTEQFIERARKLHGDKYDYSLVQYVNNRTKVKIICPACSHNNSTRSSKRLITSTLTESSILGSKSLF